MRIYESKILSKDILIKEYIDNEKTIKENVQWVHRDINLMKNKFSQEYFINICKSIAEKHK